MVVSYCALVSSSFVFVIHKLVPSHVRKLDRSNEVQIKWRMVVVFALCAFWTLLYSKIFCNTNGNSLYDLGWTWNTGDIVMVSLHTACLFLGPLVVLLVNTAVSTVKRHNSHRMPHAGATRTRKLVNWASVRDLVAAPISEEIVFRGCLVEPLLSTRLSPNQVALVAPLFFGTAHIHHSILKLRQGHSLKTVAISTIFQFTYTSMFGTYAAFAFVRTHSLPAVILSHAFCNKMGLPDLSFATDQYHHLHRIRYLLFFIYIAGISLFVYGFYSDVVFATKGV